MLLLLNSKIMKSFQFLLIVYYCGVISVTAQTKEWLVPVPGDPSGINNGTTYSFQTQDYLCWVKTKHKTKQVLNLYNGSQWKKIIVDTLVSAIYNIDNQNDSIFLTGYKDYYGDSQLVLLYNGNKWITISKLRALKGQHQGMKFLGIQDGRFYHHKLYVIFLNDDYHSTLIEYDFKTDNLKTIATFQQCKANDISAQDDKMDLFLHNDKLYLAGAYDSVNHVPSQGFGYYDGIKFVNKRLFPGTFPTNFTVVKRIDSSLFIVERPVLDANNTSKYKLYIMRNDSIIKDITGDLFLTHRKFYTHQQLSQSNLQVFLINGKIMYKDSYVGPFFEYDEAQNRWNPIEFGMNNGYAFFFKQKRYLFGDYLSNPMYYFSNQNQKACFVIRPFYYVSGLAYVDRDSNCMLTPADSLRKQEWVTLRNDSGFTSSKTNLNGSYEIPIGQGKYWFSRYNNLSPSLCQNDTIMVDSFINYYRDVKYTLVPVTSINRATDDPMLITMYPNPGNGHLKIRSKSGLEENNVRFYTSTGQELYIPPSGDNASYDISTWPVGLYFVCIKTGNHHYTLIYNKSE